MTAPAFTPAARAQARHARLVRACRQTEIHANRIALVLAALALLWIVLPALAAASQWGPM